MASALVTTRLRFPPAHSQMVRDVSFRLEEAKNAGNLKEVESLMDTIGILWALAEKAHEELTGRAW
jgi:hypothetical protein